MDTLIAKIKHYFEDKKLTKQNPVSYPRWKNIKAGKETVDMTKGCGYYITGGWNPFKHLKRGDLVLDWKNGKRAIYKLLDYKNYGDPSDMTEWSTWHLVGYKGQKFAKDCTFEEYLQIYC